MHEHTNGRAPGVAFVAADAPFGRAAIAVEFAFVGREATIGDLRPMDLQPMIDSMKSLNVRCGLPARQPFALSLSRAANTGPAFALPSNLNPNP